MDLEVKRATIPPYRRRTHLNCLSENVHEGGSSSLWHQSLEEIGRLADRIFGNQRMMDAKPGDDAIR